MGVFSPEGIQAENVDQNETEETVSLADQTEEVHILMRVELLQAVVTAPPLPHVHLGRTLLQPGGNTNVVELLSGNRSGT